MSESKEVQYGKLLQLAARKQHKQILPLLLETLHILAQASDPGEQLNDKALRRIYAEVICAFRESWNFTNLTDMGYARLMEHQATLQYLFMATDFGDSKLMLASLLPDNQNVLPLNTQEDVRRVLSVYFLNTPVDIDLNVLFKAHPSLVFPLWMGFIINKVCLDERSYLRVEAVSETKVLRCLSLINHPSDGHINLILKAWMQCSYLVGDRKHSIKRQLNRLLLNWLAKRKVSSPAVSVREVRKEQPRLLVVLEKMLHRHAMYRCYAPTLRQLKRSGFELIGIGQAEDVDEVSQGLFDRFVTLDAVSYNNINSVVDRVVKLKPEMMYYPSVGMNHWSIMLANLRLAPIQLMSLGHPATTHSKVMDYVFMTHTGYCERTPELFSEIPVLVDAGLIQFEVHPEFPVLKLEPRKAPDVIRIAINSRSFKLNYVFMKTCKAIAEQVQRPVEFVFFPTEGGVLYRALKQAIHDWFPDAEVLPMMGYVDYIERLAQCDIALGTFPFGGSNTNVDLFMLGIPKVILVGDEVHSRTDLEEVALLGDYPEWLLAKSTEAYQDAAVRLIEDDVARLQAARSVLAYKEKRLVEGGEDVCRDDAENAMARAFRIIYEKHESFKAMKVVDMNDYL